ncbi:MAG: DUF4974 domain-containing protein [Tannerellaceae bacterium]|nr:DUF4974 domain-containing protein [Tannerellaceae bacterium]
MEKNKAYKILLRLRDGMLTEEQREQIVCWLGSGHITTTLEEGSVKLYKKGDPAGSIRLKPNEQLTYLSHEEAFHIRRNVNTPDYSAWTKGNLHFINEPLDEILFTLERKYDIRFLVDQRVSTTDLYTIKYKAHESISDVIHVLTEIMGDVKFQQEGRTIRLTLKRKEVRF